jgi:hypothetical protein
VTDVAADGQRYHVTWIHNYPSCGGLILDMQDVMATLIEPGDPPAVAPPRTVSGSAAQDGVTAAVIGGRFWTAWLSERRDDPQMLAARRDAGGMLLDSEGIELGSDVQRGGRLSHLFTPRGRR